MLDSINREQVAGLNFTPAAAIRLGTARLRDAGINFFQDRDDLDDYEFAAFHLAQVGTFAFLSYANLCDKETTLMMEDGALQTADLAFAINQIAKAFRLPVESFDWRAGAEEASVHAVNQRETETGSVDLVQMLAESTPEEGRVLMGTILAEEVAAITNAQTHQIDLGRSLTDLGMDSLMAVELRMSLERRFGTNLPLLSLADESSVGAISNRIVRHLVAAAPGGRGGAAAALLVRNENDPASKDEPADTDLSPEGTAAEGRQTA